MVVADRYCFGSLPGREEIELREGESALCTPSPGTTSSNNHCPARHGSRRTS